MGCASSTGGAVDENEVAKQGKEKPTPDAPAVVAKASGPAAAATSAAKHDEKDEEDGKPEPGHSKTPMSKTRKQRLSYVTYDPNAIPMPLAVEEADKALEQEQEREGEREREKIVKTVRAQPLSSDGKGPLRVSVACISRAGKEPGFKKTNQDNCFAFEKYITEDQSLFGAMDGHGPHGHLVSGYVKQHLPIILVNHLTSADKDVQDALSAAFIEVDKSLGSSRIDCEFSGSTAVVSFLKGRTLTTAWVGDSRGVICRETAAEGVQAIDLTNDHKPTNPEEKARILRSNGRVERLVDEMGQPMGPHRVWLQYAWIPGLAMSRALGDVLAHQVGVASEPDHTEIILDPTYKFMILASDGVWEFISSKEAVDIVCQYDTVEEACRQLVDEAYQRWLTEEEGVVDDITAVVVRFLHD